ncbi:MAG: hypothetical protein JWM49_1566 [Microbacteriaceae bacterium]|nr:hypothetical protein [Microbacteriaceae bacterium]
MSFFSNVPIEPEPPRQPHRKPEPWIDAPDDELGVVLPFSTLLFRTDLTVLALTSVTAHSTGCLLAVNWALNRGERTGRQWRDLVEYSFAFGLRRADDGSLADTQLRFGVAYPDGRSARTIDGFSRPFAGPDEAGPTVEPILQSRSQGGGGGDERYNGGSHLWLYPLPPPVDFQLVYEWPAAGVPESRFSLDGAAITEAARRAQSFWPE